jgi:hypothetical protein
MDLFFNVNVFQVHDEEKKNLKHALKLAEKLLPSSDM